MKKIHKKAMVFNVMIVLFTIVVLTYAYIVLSDKLDVGKEIGESQLDAIIKIQEGEKALIFLDFAAKMASYQAAYELQERGGIGNTEQCGTYYGFSRWNSDTGETCFASSKEAKEGFKELFVTNILARMAKHPTADFISQVPEAAQPIGPANNAAVEEIQNEGIQEVPSTGGGTPPEQEIRIKCSTGECIAQMAEYYAIKYRKLPYIWGGLTPYDPELTRQSASDSESFFSGANVHYPNQPEGNEFRSGKPTQPGFDCSGFVWWVFKHASIPGFEGRQSSTAQRDYGIQNGQIVACNPTGEEITRVGQPGDLVFFGKEGERITINSCEMAKSTVHVAIYAGEGQIVESGGTRVNPPTDIDYSEFFTTYGTRNQARYGGTQKKPLTPTNRYDTLIRYPKAQDAKATQFNVQEFESRPEQTVV